LVPDGASMSVNARAGGWVTVEASTGYRMPVTIAPTSRRTPVTGVQDGGCHRWERRGERRKLSRRVTLEAAIRERKEYGTPVRILSVRGSTST
jgi:hypothetical protein